MVQTLRKEDDRVEKIIGSFLDKNLYLAKNGFFLVNRVNNSKEQIKGIDIKFMFNNKTYICDEKCASHYINKNLNTFILELSFLNKYKKLSVGWLIDSHKKNNSFLFVWVDKAKSNKLEKAKDISEIEVCLVKKENIINYLNNLGWSTDKLKNKINKIRYNPKEYCGSVNKCGVAFSKSFQLAEKPINIILTRKIYRKISDYNKKINVK